MSIVAPLAKLREKNTSVARNVAAIRTLIWVYFFFLLFEGFLRMVLPPLSNILIVIRDPFLLAAYVIAQISGVFPWNRYVTMLWLLGLVALVLGMLEWPQAPVMVLYGFRVAFLHVPLIFLIPRVMDDEDVLLFGKWFLVLAAPMAVLMAAQFLGGPDSWLNRGLDNQFKQITGAEGKIRAPGTFTYTLGPALFFAFTTAFLLLGQFRTRVFPKWLVLVASVGTAVALAISISRLALAQVAIVIAIGLLAVLVTRPTAVVGYIRFGIVVAITLAVAIQLPVFSEGTRVFATRFEQASDTEGGTEGFLERLTWDFTQAYDSMSEAEISGAGLGTGSNVGAALLFGRRGFLLAENEWPRVIRELGPLIGATVLLMRVGLVIWLFAKALGMARKGVMLPILLFGATAPSLFNGIWSQPTVLGFAVIGGGLCLASMNVKTIETTKPVRS